MNENKSILYKNILVKTVAKVSRRAMLFASAAVAVPSVVYGAHKKTVQKKAVVYSKHTTSHRAVVHSKHTISHRTVNSKAPAIIGQAKRPLPSIVLDPGHGGKDPGAIGYSGTYEKHIAYAVAVELYRQLMRTGRYQVSLTRNADHFIPLDGRVNFAQSKKANLFISIHADALSNSSVRGASVYTLSNKASDAQSAALASIENRADRYGGPSVRVASPAVQKILASLVKLETKRESMTMAQTVVSSFNSRVGLLSHPKRHAAFVVLKSVDIPSVLVEMGFMSNKKDEDALRHAGYRSVVASSMRNAIDRYFKIGGSVTHLTG